MAAAMAGPERQDGGKPLGDDGVLVVAPSSSGDTLGALQTDDDGTMALKARARLLFKIDMWLMPMLMITWGLQWFEKSAFGFAAVYSFRKDNHLQGSDYSWTIAIFYIGYMIFQFPISYFMQYFRVERYLGLSICCWGLVLVMLNFSSSFAGLATGRFFLGTFESIIPPAFVIVTSRWYAPRDQPLRQIIWYAGIPFFGIFASLVSYGLGYGKHLAAWRSLFILIGGLAMLWGVAIFFFLPADPERVKWLSVEERAILDTMTQKPEVETDELEKGGEQAEHWEWKDFRIAAVDPRTWILFLIGFTYTVPSGVLSNFSSLLIKGLGFSTLDTLLLDIPSHVIQLIAMASAGLVAVLVRDTTTYMMMLVCIPPIVGTAVLTAVPQANKWGRLVCVWIIFTHTTLIPLAISLISSNATGFTKKAVISCVLFLGFSAGNIVSPHLFKANEEKEGYPTGIKALLGCFVSSVVLSGVLRVFYWMDRRKGLTVQL